MIKQRYYILHNSRKVYFEGTAKGYRDAVMYVTRNKLGKRKLYTELCYEK